MYQFKQPKGDAQSAGFWAVAKTLMRTWPSPGTGMGTSLTWRWPSLSVTTTAFIFVFMCADFKCALMLKLKLLLVPYVKAVEDSALCWVRVWSLEVKLSLRLVTRTWAWNILHSVKSSEIYTPTSYNNSIVNSIRFASSWSSPGRRLCNLGQVISKHLSVSWSSEW